MNLTKPKPNAGVVQAGGLPRVNLLPREIGQKKRLRDIQLLLSVLVLLAVVGVVFLTWRASSAVSDANKRIDDAASEHADLQHQLTELKPVVDTKNKVAAEKALLERATATKVAWSGVLAGLSKNVPSGVSVTGLSIRETAMPGSAMNRTAITGPIGTISYEGVAPSHDSVATWLDTITKPKYLVNSWYASSVEGTAGGSANGSKHPASAKEVTFQGSVDITSAALVPKSDG